MNDLISIIIPVKNGSKYIIQAIECILNQNMNVEIIVVDDFSDDNTADIAKMYNCKLVRHDKTLGQVAGKNSGLKVADGKYVMFHDHDDMMRKGSLERLYNEISSDENIAAVEAKVQDFYSPDLSEEERNKTLIKKEPYWGLFTGAILMRKDIFDTVGYFRDDVYTGEIIEWQNKLNSAGLYVKKIDFVSTDRRVHSTNFGKTNQKTEFKDYAAILRAKLLAKK